MQTDEISIKPVATTEGFVAAADLLAEIWGVAHASPPLPPDVLASLSSAGGSVLGAWQADKLVGATVAVAGAPCSRHVHSLIAGVHSSAAGTGLGRRLKLAQRDWALENGARWLEWTYDPLVRRNAHFNLNRLRANVVNFVEDFFPPMFDALNAGDRPDRFFVVWDLEASAANPVTGMDGAEREPGGDSVALSRDSDGSPTVSTGLDSASVRAWIPEDIEAVRRDDPALAMAWRLASREVFADLFDRGYRPVRLDVTGHYDFRCTSDKS